MGSVKARSASFESIGSLREEIRDHKSMRTEENARERHHNLHLS